MRDGVLGKFCNHHNPTRNGDDVNRQTQFIRKAGLTSGTIESLPGDITDIILKRIVYLCLFAAGLAMFGVLHCYVVMPLLSKGEAFTVLSNNAYDFGSNVLTIAVALVVAWLVHRRKFSSRSLINIGLGFGVYVAMWLSYGDCASLINDNFTASAYFSFNQAWVVFLPAIIPIRSRATIIAVLLIGAMPPLSRGLIESLGWVQLPADSQHILILVMLLSTTMGLIVSHVVYRLGKSVKAAREMGSYTLEESLGDGGMGEVWRASHRMLARPAAVKLIKPEVFIGMSPAEIDRLNNRFEHEAQSTAALFSPHTVDIYDYGVASDGTFFYVMELLDGIDMESLVERFGPVEPSRVVHFLIQVCHSLNEANNRQMIHRDIKPANLFVCRYGDDFDFVKVLDFGLVKRETIKDKERLKLTAEGAVTGTPAYMSPEAVLGKSPVDHRSDLYSLGCVAYWLLTGRLVFTAETPMAVLMKHATAEPEPPSKRSELEIPEELDSVILSCLAKEPGDRPQTAEELAGRLTKIDFRQPWDQKRAQAWWKVHVPTGNLPA